MGADYLRENSVFLKFQVLLVTFIYVLGQKSLNKLKN